MPPPERVGTKSPDSRGCMMKFMIVGDRTSAGVAPALFRTALMACCLAAAVLEPLAERLPVRTFGKFDGLPHSRVSAISQDSHGFLWFGTAEGLGRYDGGRFRVYDSSDGLPTDGVNDLLETARGEHWVATDGGACRLVRTASEGSPFVCPALEGEEGRVSVISLTESSDGSLWLASSAGLFRLDRQREPWIFRQVELAPSGQAGVIHVVLDMGDGLLWVGATAGLYRRDPSGMVERFTFRPPGSRQTVRDLLAESDGTLWIGHDEGLILMRPEEPPESRTDGPARLHQVALEEVKLEASRFDEELPRRPGTARRYILQDVITHKAVRRIARGEDGKIYILQIGGGLIEVHHGEIRRYAKDEGLADDSLNDVLLDRAGDLWLGSDASGAMRIPGNGMVSYGLGDGLGHTFVTSVFQDGAGSLWAISGNFHLSRSVGSRFESHQLLPPEGRTDPYFFSTGMMDSHGGVWAPTSVGVYRFDSAGAPGRDDPMRPAAVIAAPGDEWGVPTGILHEDGDGDVWIGLNPGGKAPLLRWERATRGLKGLEPESGIPPGSMVSAMKDSPQGHLWIGLDSGQVGWLDAGRFRLLGPGDGLPEGWVNDLYFDGSGSLWVASARGGLVRIDDPGTDRPKVRLFTRKDGLCSERVRTVLEDGAGRIYAGTTRGVCRLDRPGDRFRSLDISDGLANDEVLSSCRDGKGDLWFGTLDGLSRLSPQPERSPAPPEIRIGELHLSGERISPDPLGTGEYHGPSLPAGRNHVRIDYFGIPFATGEAISYQYRLAGAGSAWSAPTTNRSVTLASLAPGDYRFEVRAVGEDGQGSSRPATASFSILPPFYRTPWFMALAAALLVAAAVTLHRGRLARALAVERLRTRIATDLHDDVGSNLSKIAILAELIRRKEEPGAGDSSRLLGQIADVSRETVDSMGDIVWAINPSKDRLEDLANRMRRFGNDLLSAREIRFALTAEEAVRRAHLGIDARRQLFLIFKEALNNAVRHSGCGAIDVSLALEGAVVVLTLRDDGAGFDPDSSPAGHGLASMRSRARETGGELRIDSRPGEGATVEARIPVGR